MLKYTVGKSSEYELEKKDWPFQYFDPKDEFDLESFAQACAQDYRESHDGWEEWRDGERDVALFWNGNLVGEFEVELEFVASYTAYSK